MKTRKRFFLPAFRNAVPADFEAWFEHLASEGWFPKNITHTSSLLMSFFKGSPKKYRYVADVQAMPNDDYIATYKEFGWEFVGQMSGIFIWRREYTSDRPEAFSDKENIKNRNRRFAKAVSFSFSIFLLASLIITACLFLNISRLGIGDWVQFILGLALSYSITASLASVMVRILKAER